MTCKQARDHITDTSPLFRQAHTDRTAVNFAALMVHKAHFHQLFQVIADVATLIVAARLELARRNLVITDVE